MLRSVVLFLAVISVTFAALSLMVPDPKPDKFKDIEGCYIKELDAVIPPGEEKPSKKGCSSYTCGDEFVTFKSCGVSAVSPRCKLVEHNDFNLYPFPKCCPTVEC